MLKKFDDEFRQKYKANFLCGIDEAGRGPLAGPVVAAAVVFPEYVFIEGVNDSKKLTASKREFLYEQIINKCLAYSVSIVDIKTIDEINILQASLLAMKNAVDSLAKNPDLIIIDGNKTFISQHRKLAIVQGDSKSFSIAAASIIAKVTRDRIMEDLHTEFEMYNWKKNKGYGTKEHVEAIKKHGVTLHHRKSFLKKILELKNE